MKPALEKMKQDITRIRPSIPLPNRVKFAAEWRAYYEAMAKADTPAAEAVVAKEWAERIAVLSTSPRAGAIPPARPRRDGETPEQYLTDIFRR